MCCSTQPLRLCIKISIYCDVRACILHRKIGGGQTGVTGSSQIPHDRGQGLVSGLHRNSVPRRDCFGFNVRHITLGANSQRRGPSDKWPVLAHRGRTTCEKGALFSTENILPTHGVLAWNPANVPLERSVGETSLSGEPECLSPQGV